MPFQPPPEKIVQQFRPLLIYFVDRLLAMRWPLDAVITSWWRDPHRNRSVGGSPLSQHLWGGAIDVASAANRGQIVAEARRVGLVAIDEGSHVHIQAVPAAWNPLRWIGNPIYP